MLNRDENEKINKVAEALGVSRKSGKDVVGQAPDNSKRWTNGMDDIDDWAAGVGQAESAARYYRPNKANKPHNANRAR